MITLEALHVTAGETTVTFDEVQPGERAKLAKTITKLIRDGNAVFVKLESGETRIVDGYDAEENEWVLRGQRKGKEKGDRVGAKDSTVTSVAPSAGG